MGNGYAGKLLFVDLNAGTLVEESPDGAFYRDCIGGTGLGAKILMERMKPGADPLGPDNMLGFVTGPLTAAGVYGAGRFMVTTKSPLTGGWADSNCGGTWGPELKNAGYDGVFVTGVAETPAILVIDAGKARLEDASDLWGKDTYDTEDMLQARLGGPGEWKIASVGPAGEMQTLLAGIVHDKGRIAARSGVGAVMGAKRLKAVAVRAAKGARIGVADKEGLKAVQRQYSEMIKSSGFLGGLKAAGTGSSVGFLVSIGDAPTYNWTKTGTDSLPSAGELDGAKMDKYKVKPYGCSTCPVKCGALVKITDGPYASQDETHRPEYETLGSLGTCCANDNPEVIVRANEICNRYGIDTISVGGTIAFAMECYEKGLIDKTDTGGLELTFGNGPATVALTEQMAKREGFGAVLADGSKRAAERIGKGSEQYAMHVGGRELPLHDPRLAPAMGTYYIGDATPSQHCGPQQMCMLEQGTSIGSDPLLEATPAEPFGDWDRKGEPYARGAAYWHLLSSAGLCSLYSQFDTPPVVELLRPVTGWDMDWEEGLRAGRRILTLRQAFNVREGLAPQDFRLPRRFEAHLMAGPAAEAPVPPFEDLREEYYKALGWDPKTGAPLAETLVELGLS
jgi:aldehyde:ferredoxin oxidoreductase